MATSLELQAAQKNKLFMLLTIKADKTDETIDRFINEIKAEMSQEDVAWVEKMVAQSED